MINKKKGLAEKNLIYFKVKIKTRIVLTPEEGYREL